MLLVDINKLASRHDLIGWLILSAASAYRSVSYPGRFALSGLLEEAWNGVRQKTSHPKSPRTTGNEAEHKHCPRPQIINKDMNERVAVVPYA